VRHMSAKFLTKVLILLIVLILLNVAALHVVGKVEKKVRHKFIISKHATGSFNTYEAYHHPFVKKYRHFKTTKRYDDKFFDYLEHKQKARDKTFFR